MAFLTDLRDIEFNLFECLNIQNLQKYSAYSAYSGQDYQSFLSEALKFTEKEIAPLNRKADQEGCHLKDGVLQVPTGFAEAYQKFAASGFVAVDVPTTYGGMGLPVVLSISMAEIFIAGCFSFMMFPGLTRGASHLIEAFGEESLAALYCPKMYGGEWTGTMCLTEPQAGSAVGDLRTTASPVGDGTYKIKGQKIFISCGDNNFTSNVIHLVLARVPGDPEGTKGISLFVVPKIRVGAEGSLGKLNDVKTVNIEEKLGIHGSPTCTLAFGDNDDCIGFLIGERCKGMPYMFQMMNEARLMTGIQGLSTASSAYLNAIQYTKERIQGGNTAIVQYPDVKRMLTTMKAFVEGLRGLFYQVGYYMDLAEQETDAALKEKYQGFADLLTPVCKSFGSDRGFDVTVMAMQCYGGYGYCQEYPVEQMVRDVKISSIYEGTNGIQALDLVGRKMGMKGGEVFREFYQMIDQSAQKGASHPTLSKEFSALKKAIDQIGQCAMKTAELGMSGQRDYVAMQAVNFLNMMGYVCLAWVLLEQALVALPKLEALWQKAGADVEEKKAALCESNEDAKYYESKVKVARFFVSNLLPQLHALAKGFLSEDPSAMRIRY
ncbi:MAG: acyl-CoA dehydrogenase [Deltaproteobacteria bacterium]|nr:acyl-CoA dehydrogenase [Deltaproteobacteria bacterium]